MTMPQLMASMAGLSVSQGIYYSPLWFVGGTLIACWSVAISWRYT